MTTLLFSINVEYTLSIFVWFFVCWYVLKDDYGKYKKLDLSEQPMSPKQLYEFEKEKAKLNFRGRLIIPFGVLIVCLPIGYISVLIFGSSIFGYIFSSALSAGIVANYIKHIRKQYIDLYENLGKE